MAAVQPLGPHTAPNPPPAPLVAKPPTPGETARRDFAPTAADVADADAALKRMEAEFAATPEAAPLRLLSYAEMRDAARQARGGQRPATRLRAVATHRPSLGDPVSGPARPLLAPSEPVEKQPPRKKRKQRNKAASDDNRIYGTDKTGRPNWAVGQAWGYLAGDDAPKYVQCLEGTPHKPGPAVPGAKEWPAEAVPTECLLYPDYKEDRGSQMFKKGKSAKAFYKANGYYKIAVNNGHYANSSKAVFKFFKEVARA